jgi:general secretion pathway protein I
MRARGFSLLEVMIALAILALGLVAISQVNAGSIQMHAYARRATQGSLLLRGKMLDLEELLTKDGFSDYDDEKHGTFEDDGAPEYAWRAEILKPKISLDADGLLGMLGMGGSKGSSSASSGSNPLGSLMGGLAGGAGLPGGGLTGGAGLAAAGPFAGMIQGQAKGFIETLKKSVREVRVTVTWKDGKIEHSISASQQMVILPESVGKAGSSGTGVSADGSTASPTNPLPTGTK